MAEHEDWTAGDDAQLRRAMATLRRDVEAVPLPDVRFVRARGVRRRRQRALALTAAAAAAVVVVGAVGFSQLGRDASLPVTPATRSSTVPTTPPSTTTSATADPLDKPGALPLVTDWTSSLDLTGSVLLTPVKPFGPIECLQSEPGTKVQQEEVTRAPDLQGGQVRFRIGSGQDAATAADGVASDIAGCSLAPGYKVTPASSGTGQRVYSYTAGDAGSGWWAVVAGKHDVVVLQVNQNDRPKSGFTLAQVQELVSIAQKRLARYGTGTKGAASTTSSPSFTGPKAVDQQMPVVGPSPVPSWKLFVAASQWSSTALTAGAATSAGPGAMEGSTAVASCETDQEQAGIGGRVGVVSIRVGSSSTGYIGRQRVQLDDSSGADVQQSYVDARLAEAKALFGKGCSTGNGTVKSTPGPTAGTWRLDTVFTDGSPTFSEWVGVTAQRTPGTVSTVVVTKVSDPAQGFAELDRLLNLAKQK